MRLNTKNKNKGSSVARKKLKKVYKYQCTITEEFYKTTREAPNPDELVCVEAYYEMHPEEDDRPENIKIQLQED